MKTSAARLRNPDMAHLLLAILIPPILLLGFPIVHSASAGSATWSATPINNDWNKAENWTPATVPNSPTDIATFEVSPQVGLQISADTEVAAIVFPPGADRFRIVAGDNDDPWVLTLSGSGIENSSGLTQSFVVRDGLEEIDFRNSATVTGKTTFATRGGRFFGAAGINFFDTATAGTGLFTNSNPYTEDTPGSTNFYDHSSAGSGRFMNNGGGTQNARSATTMFYDYSTAGQAIIRNNPGTANKSGETHFRGHATAGQARVINMRSPDFYYGGTTDFSESSTAGDAVITNQGGGESGGETAFFAGSSAGNATIINEGGVTDGGADGRVDFFGGDAGRATIICNGATAGGFGGEADFTAGASAGESTIIVRGGPGTDGGGFVVFDSEASGGTARLEVFGNGHVRFDTSLTIGSIEGDGDIESGYRDLTVGSNNLSTLFHGRLLSLGHFTKIGTGTLTLIGTALSRTGTTVDGGKLVIHRSLPPNRGAGPFLVKSGTLGGTATIPGSITIGEADASGAALEPGDPRAPFGTLLTQKELIFQAQGTLRIPLESDTASAGQVGAQGVTISDGKFMITDTGNSTLPSGATFTVISNTTTTPIAGTFTDLPDGGTITAGNNTFQANYEGGDGNDLTLTVVP